MSARSFHRPQDRRRGIALVMSLIFLAITTLMVVGFLSIMRLDHSATASYSQSLNADQLAHAGLNLMVAQLQAEMAKDALPNTSYPKSPLYTNVASTNFLPQPVGTNSAMTNLVKISTTQALFSGRIQTSPLAASTASSATPSLNGRSVGVNRWNMPYLGAFPSAGSTPKWIVVTRNGPTNALGLPFSGPGALNDPSTNNANYALGRLAYAIYDEGGLLNVNMAGYPSAASASQVENKGAAIWADLSQIPGITPDKLLTWRNGTTASSYSNYVTAIWPTNGFRTVAPGDMAFLNRQDLIQAAQNQQAGLTTNALPYLTTFSHDLNTPSWGPTTNTGGAYNYASNANTATSTNRFFPNVRVLNSFLRRDGTTAAVGEPLMTRRFPLGKLALVSYTATATTSSDIYKYFGLTRASAASPWVYRSGAASILTLDQVANLSGANAREPDFFELLQACLLSGSTGVKAPNTTTVPNNNALLDPNAFLQIMRIGANLIDQQDADNYPTQVTFNGSTIAGIEDLPYPNKIFIKILSTDLFAAGSQPMLFFELWNPHQAPTAAITASPTQFQVVSNPGGTSTVGLMVQPNPSGTAVFLNQAAVTFPSSPSPTSFTFTLPANQCREPWIITGGSGAALSVLHGPSALTPNGFLLGKGVKIPATYPTTYPESTVSYTMGLANAIFSFQYKDAFANWQTYATSSGFTNTVATGIQMAGTMHYQVTSITGGASFPQDASKDNWMAWGLMKSDPRTARFGWSMFSYAGLSVSGVPTTTATTPVFTQYYYMNNPLLPATNPAYTLTAQAYNPFGTPGFNIKYRMDLFSQNTSVTSGFGYTDNDGVLRPGDCSLSATLQPMQSQNTPARPVILNRPFQSVGEMGYAFRDMPWKTLDFFSANSADAALLDAFSVEDATNVSGRISLNTRNTTVLKAMLSGALSREIGGTPLSPSAADTMAQAIVASSAVTNAMLNPADLVARIATNTAAFTFVNKMERESTVRALASATSARTWNLLIDLVAQTGKYPSTASGLDQFVVEGEKRYWLHVAIDRFTGQVINRQIEPVISQ